jgi:GWxTD domain-containing protein
MLQLERGLDKETQDWYAQHRFIMEYNVPKDLGGKSEREYFLRLSSESKNKYMKSFWDIREIGMQEEWSLRMSVVKRWFRGEGIDPWNTDMGRIMLLLGQPFEEQFRDQYGNPYLEGAQEWMRERETIIYYRIWLYWHGSGFFQQIYYVRFRWDGINSWRYIDNTDAMYQNFITYWKWRMAPTPDGWELWRSKIGGL